MNPTEQARLTDHQEFAAECLAIRQRAYALVADRRARMREAVDRWLNRPNSPQCKSDVIAPAVKTSSRQHMQTIERTVRLPRGVKPKLHEFGGVRLTREQWAAELGISPAAFSTRVHRLGSVEAAIAAGRMSTYTNTHILSRMVKGFRRVRNRQIIQRIASSFRSHTPGYVQTFHNAKGTGVGRHAHDLHQNSENRP